MSRLIAAFLGATALSVACAPTAFAADMPARAPMYTKAPSAFYNWTGLYVGATAGVGWSTADVSLNPVNGAIPNYRPEDLGPVAALGSSKITGANGIFGGKIGYNQQFNAWVLGVEADFSSFRFNKSVTTTGAPFPGFPLFPATFNTSVSSDWLATVRPRIGYAVERALFYGTAGVAFGKVSFSNTEQEVAPNGLGVGTEASSASKTKVGWAAGAGVDYALTRNWILSAEYLHVDLGSIKASGLVTNGLPSTANLNFSTKVRSDIARVGVAYKF